VFKSVLKRMFGCKGSVLLTAVSIASFLMSSAFPFLNGRFVDFLVYDTSMNVVISFAFVLAGVGLLSVIFSYIAGIVSVKVSSETSFSILVEIIGRFQHADLRHVEEMEKRLYLSADHN
jgi:ABC-type multidrug transport system fused ATPase/permease subunit